MKYLIVVLLFFSFGGVSAQKLLSQDRYENGHLRTSVYSENGNIHFVAYHENGRVAEMGSYKNGARTGLWKTYDPSGNLMAHGRFINDRRVGKWSFRILGGDGEGTADDDCGVLLSGEMWDSAGNLIASAN